MVKFCAGGDGGGLTDWQGPTGREKVTMGGRPGHQVASLRLKGREMTDSLKRFLELVQKTCKRLDCFSDGIADRPLHGWEYPGHEQQLVPHGRLHSPLRVRWLWPSCTQTVPSSQKSQEPNRASAEVVHCSFHSSSYALPDTARMSTCTFFRARATMSRPFPKP